MREELDSLVAASLDAAPDLLPHLPELLADCQELGSAAGAIVDLLRPLQLQGARVLDLGCGKGAIAVACARQLGCRVHGVDGIAAFVAEATRRAAKAGCSECCTFTCEDLRDTLASARSFDVVILASVGPLIDGRPCVQALRPCVKPGGYLLIDDGFLPEGVAEVPPHYACYRPYAETRAQLTAAGDVIEREIITTPDDYVDANDHMTELIRRRAADLARRSPELSERLQAYLRNQEHECELLRRFHVPATWLIRRVSR